MVRPRRVWTVVSAFCVILAVCTFLGYQHTTDGFTITQTIKPHKGRCDSELDSLRRLIELPTKVQYARRRIEARPVKDLQQPSIVQIEENLLEGFASLDLSDRDCSLPETGSPMIMEYPEFVPPSEVDTSTIMFGASTQLGRLRAAIPLMARWLGNSSSQIVVNVHDNDDLGKLEDVQNEAEAAGINAEFIQNMQFSEGEDWHAQRHFDILKTFYKHRGDNHQWFGIIDDDTFIPSLPALHEALSKYDPSKPYYIGQLSESWTAIADYFGYMAYGGAGMFISRALLDALYEKFDVCKSTSREGDSMYSICIYQEISPPVQLTLLNGLHQLDLREDPSGWYEGGIKPMLSLHHFRSWHLFPVEFAHLFSDICGHDCFLQRYHFADDTVLTNAFSVVKYPQGVDTVDLHRVEGTFQHGETDFDFSLGHLRTPLSPHDKISYRLEYSIREDDGRVRQFYIKRTGEPKNDAERLRLEVDAVFELEWSR